MSTVLLVDIGQLVQVPVQAHNDAPVLMTPNAFVWIEDGRVQRTGPMQGLPSDAPGQRLSLGGRAVLPGLVDSHTHVVFAGERMDEMARRARGETYEQIAAAGGGIRRSVAALQAASETDLVTPSLQRLQHMLTRGTTTVEIKTGYGLDVALERKHLQAIEAVAKLAPQDVRTTLLAHGIPQGQDAASHLATFATFIGEAAARGAAQYVDAFVEQGALTPAQTRALAAAARDAGLRVKLHVDQLRDGHGAALAAELKALSADHLEYTGEDGARALAAAGVVGTLLPGCGLFLGKGPWPNGRLLRDAGVELAVATDCNPGSSMVQDLLLCATLAATRCGLTLEEALWGVTRGGAKALGLADRGGLLQGERGDVLVLDHSDWRAALYMPGAVPIYGVMRGGSWALAPH